MPSAETQQASRAAADAPVGTLERGLSILQFFKTSPEATIPEVAEALGLSRSTTYRIAERLRELGFLEVNADTSRWRLGREAVQLGVVALQSTDVMQVAPELLRAAAARWPARRSTSPSSMPTAWCCSIASRGRNR